MNIEERTDVALIDDADAVHSTVSRSQRQLFALIAEIDRRRLWERSGARDMSQWLSMRYGISCWKANRLIAAAHALADLPVTAEAFASGRLGIDKVVELARFATRDTEARLVEWGTDVSGASIRRRADLVARTEVDRARNADESRFVTWSYFDEGTRFSLEAELPAA